MIDVVHEQVLPLTAAARELPSRSGALGVNVSTVWRWSLRGIRGVRLETVLVGGIRMTSREALQRFFSAATAAANGETPSAQTCKQRQRAIDEAEAELSAAGI